MYLLSVNRRLKLELLALVLVLLAGSASQARAQRPSTPNNPRDMVRAINRQEMDRLLRLKLLPPLKNDPARRMLLKQIGDDFRDLQNLNNRMMSETWARSQIDYGFVSNMISQIRTKANRLKGNLNLPQPLNLKAEQLPDPANDEEFRAALMTLDQTIMGFVQNPIFQNTNSLPVDQAAQAGRDLETILDLTSDLRKVVVKLGRTTHR